MSKFSPGPWFVDSTGDCVYSSAISEVTHEHWMVAEVEGRTANESGANSRLIAAAPEMYELLGRILSGDCTGVGDGCFADEITALLARIPQGDEP